MIRTGLFFTFFSAFLLQSASASVLSKADATHSVTITGVTGDTSDISFLAMDIDVLSITEDASGEGTTAAAASLFVGATELFAGGIYPIAAGDTILAASSATAERSTPGWSIAHSDVVTDLVFSLDAAASGPVTVEMTYFASVTARVTGSIIGHTGAAFSDADFSDDGSFEILTSVGVDPGDGLEADFAFSFESVTLVPGDSVSVVFDLIQSAEAHAIPEPSMAFACVAMFGFVSLRRRTRI